MRETHKERKLRDQRRTGELENMGVDKYIKIKYGGKTCEEV